MKNRPTELAPPDRAPYIVVGLPDREDHDLKVPSAMAVTKIVQHLDQLHIATLVSMDPNGVDPQTVLTLVKQSGPEMCAAMGALLGRAWYHRTKALEAAEDSGVDVLGYGEAVFEELHDSGYTLEEIVLLALTIVRGLWDQSQFSEEVNRRANFFSLMLAQTNTSTSISGSAISDPPSDGMN